MGENGRAQSLSALAGCSLCVSRSKSEPDYDILGVPPPTLNSLQRGRPCPLTARRERGVSGCSHYLGRHHRASRWCLHDGLGYFSSLGPLLASAGLPVPTPWLLLFRAGSSSVTECVGELLAPPLVSTAAALAPASCVARAFAWLTRGDLLVGPDCELALAAPSCLTPFCSPDVELLDAIFSSLRLLLVDAS